MALTLVVARPGGTLSGTLALLTYLGHSLSFRALVGMRCRRMYRAFRTYPAIQDGIDRHSQPMITRPQIAELQNDR